MHHKRSRFDTWADAIDPDVRDAIGAPQAWLGVSVIVVFVVGVASFIPAVRANLQLQSVNAILCFLPAAVLGVTIGVLQQRRLLSSRRFALLALVDSALGQFFCWSLVAWSQWPGAGVMVAFPALLGGFHGYALQSSPRHPFIAFGGLAALAGAAVLNHDAPHLTLYAIGGPLCFGGTLVLGLNAERAGRSARERAAWLDAINAQTLHERTRQLDTVAALLLEARGASHDANSALSAMVTSIERLVVLSARLPDQGATATEINELSIGVSTSLHRLQELLRRARSPGDEQHLLAVPVGKLVKDAAQEIQRRYPGVRIETSETDANADVCGGEANLMRILTNLLSNACEGNGRTGASRVSIDVRPILHPVGVKIEIVDDGPGLPEDFDAAQLRAFQTTKQDGTGLGLYTARQLLLASGGRLFVEARHDGAGVVARVVLRSSSDPRSLVTEA